VADPVGAMIRARLHTLQGTSDSDCNWVSKELFHWFGYLSISCVIPLFDYRND
jgi:hypothetical protein